MLFKMKYLLLLAALFTSVSLQATNFLIAPDSAANQMVAVADSTPAAKTSSNLPSPKKAAILSAVLPGLGQAYNKKYWKIPILYTGGAVLGYYIGFNNRYYKRFKTAIKLRTDGDTNTVDEYATTYPNEAQLRTGRDYYRRNRDLLIIVSAFTYLLNIADASVDAHLAGFNVSDDLALRVSPEVMPIPNSMAMAGGLSLRLSWRK
ncbi:hypothetical protein SAMN05421780_102156 [Flexibacter flexilis DSM 6793]|uniref:DUF5683 domain-containing protein n=2 Tax=Flexibacter flexilis TaxID=998 RepID=A0A1I1FEE5_9BACT|nr:hypothetical protein SAMN05421780_102156 [Flexibacter flexilis DSM 6793]